MQIKGVMGFGKTDEQYTGSVMLRSVFKTMFGVGFGKTGFVF